MSTTKYDALIAEATEIGRMDSTMRQACSVVSRLADALRESEARLKTSQAFRAELADVSAKTAKAAFELLARADAADAQLARMREGFQLAKAYIDESPCDPDIFPDQFKAWEAYQSFLANHTPSGGTESERAP